MGFRGRGFRISLVGSLIEDGCGFGVWVGFVLKVKLKDFIFGLKR